MKPMRWVILVCVVMGMVFLFSFVVNFLPAWGKRSVPKNTGSQARLTFADKFTSFPAPEEGAPVTPVTGATTAALLASPVGAGPLLATASLAPAGDDQPRPPPPPAICEIGKSQSHDFWFKNQNTQDLPVGIVSTTCQCTSVQLWIAPGDWTDLPAPADRQQAVKTLEAAKPTILKDKEKAETAVIPPGAVGVVRLSWTGDREGEKSLAATMWMGEKGPGPTQVFEIRTFFMGPLHSTKEMNFPDLTREQLPRTGWVWCWSSTRTEFPLDAQLLNSRSKEGADPFFVGKPEQLTEKELSALRQRLIEEATALKQDSRGVKVLAGYKTPVILLPHAPLTDKELTELRQDPANLAGLADYKAAPSTAETKTTPFDLGAFHRRIELKTEGGDAMQVVVAGSIRGDLGPQDPAAVPVRFLKFARTEEKKLPLVLESEADVARLELDRERTPEFLDVEFPQDPVQSGGRKVWNLQVKWVVGKGEGVFPRDEEGYRDSAVFIRPVYAKTDGAAPPCLRIPVMGTADAP